jgi:hypothetical protein
MDRDISPDKIQKGRMAEILNMRRKKMKKRVVIVLLTGLVIASLAGCGTKADATDQEFSESSSAETEADDEITNEEVVGEDAETSDFAGAEDENIVLYAEAGKQEYIPLSDSEYYEEDKTFVSETEEMYLYNGEGRKVGYVKTGHPIIATEQAKDIAWSRFKNPVDGTDYDYLYILNDYFIESTKLHLDAVSMKQGIEDYIKQYGLEEIEYTFLNEKASDMELFECRMDSVYDDEIEYTYWIGQQIYSEEFRPTNYETLYIECEEDTDGWIICRIYYKDLFDLEY